MQTNTLREIRVSLNLKQTDVASQLGHASPDRISHWEKGSALPGLLNLFKLSVIYGVTPEQLYPDLYQSIITGIKSGSNLLPIKAEEGERDIQPHENKTTLQMQGGFI
ncbi:MAG: helix-turn-helix transcriptional regulator [Candidatus Pacebacteria bacterium]|nr:helix-turn-helix transcriptional regulator [Candidatus Paceibacterota bacterium]